MLGLHFVLGIRNARATFVPCVRNAGSTCLVARVLLFELLWQWQYINADCKAMLTASNADSGDRRNIAVISPPGQCQVISTAESLVGGVTVDPFAVASINGAPGVGRVSTYQAWLAGWRDSSQVRAIPRCQVTGPLTGLEKNLCATMRRFDAPQDNRPMAPCQQPVKAPRETAG